MSEGDNTSVYIYNGVGEVPEDVTHVRVDPSVTFIPASAFEDREQLEEVELPEGLLTIEPKAFANCYLLSKINLPSTVLEIHIDAFCECYELDGINLPEGLLSLGEYAFCNCESLESTINIPPSLERIERGAFLYCSSLSEVELSGGLEQIGNDAFSSCRSLVSVKLPFSLKVIGEEAFEDCPLLNEIYIPDTIERIQARAFKNCNFTNFRIPPSIGSVVDVSIVGSNTSLVSLELPETVERLEDYHDEDVRCSDMSIRNVALPSNCVLDTGALHNSLDLRKVFSYTTILGALKQRFNDLPIHKICYYQSYHDTETTMQHLKREINPWTSKPPGQLNTTGKQQDCLGMTPLHILACSTKPTIEMYRLLIEKYPETLIMKDKWGDIPLLYVIWCNAPVEVLDLLVKSYKTLHPDYEFDWKGMIETLAKRNVPMANVQTLVTTQQNSFPDQKYDMQQVVMQLAVHDISQKRFQKPCTAVDTIQYLLRVSIAKRLDSLGIRSWHEELGHNINALSKDIMLRDKYIRTVYSKLAAYEIAKESTSILELALWKAKIDENSNKRARVSGEVISYKEQCRINCGADIIIRNVLPYLVPEFEFGSV